MAGYGDAVPPIFNGEGRQLDTVYASGSKTVLASYTVTLSVTASLSGGQNAKAEAQIRPIGGAWEAVASCSLDVSFTISLVTLALTQTDDRTLVFFVPAGHEYRVVSSGTGTVVMPHTHEVEL